MTATKHSSRAAVRLLENGCDALADIEANGVMVSRPNLKAAFRRCDEIIEETQARMLKDEEVYPSWKKRFGESTNITSGPQLREVVYGILGHQPVKKTSTGLDSVDKESMNHLDYQFIRDREKCVGLGKLKSTYLKGIERELVRHDDGLWYVHPMYSLNSVVTYRSGCSKPNFMNIPVRNPLYGELVRSCYAAPPGYHMAEIDFSGVEVKVGCCVHKDPNMVRYINDPTTDMHRDQAMRLFKLTKEQVNKKTTRDVSKNMLVFPEFYGGVYFQCAPDIWEALNDPQRNFRVGEDGISIRKHLRKQGITKLGDCDPRADNGPETFVNRVREVERAMWEKDFPVYAKWKRTFWEQYQREGGFSTVTGFRVNLHMKRNEVVNSPVQGPAFHCLLWTLIQMTRWLRKNKMKSRIVGQIHDSAIFYLWPPESDEVMSHAKWLMTEALPQEWKWITVPLEVEGEITPIGGTWIEKDSYQFKA